MSLVKLTTSLLLSQSKLLGTCNYSWCPRPCTPKKVFSKKRKFIYLDYYLQDYFLLKGKDFYVVSKYVSVLQTTKNFRK